MNYKYFTSPPLIFMSKRQTINVTFVSLMSTIILLFTRSHAMSPQLSSSLKGSELRLQQWEGDTDVIGWRYLRTYWSQIKPSQSRNSNTINECGVRRATARMCLTPIADSGMSWAHLYSDKSRHRDTWHVTWCHGECQVAQTNIGLLIARAIAAWLLVFAHPQLTDRDHWQMECLFCCQMSDISTPAQEHKYVDNIQIYDQ